MNVNPFSPHSMYLMHVAKNVMNAGMPKNLEAKVSNDGTNTMLIKDMDFGNIIRRVSGGLILENMHKSKGQKISVKI